MQELLTFVFQFVLSPAIAGFIAWFFTRKKYKTEVDSGELDNVDKALKIYREAIKDLELWKGELLAKMVDIEKENTELRQQLKESHRDNNKLRQRIYVLEKDLEILKLNR